MSTRKHGHGVVLAALCLCGPPLSAQIPAFPGAEGFGAYATGGRGGDVYYVLNLNNSGAGSFADAIATVPSGGRTIVFGVSGYIHVNKTSLSKSKVTIAGQTAPGDGIGFKDGSFIINGSDVVIRHARFRYGAQAAGGDCINLDEGITNVILDQVSLAFSTDENISSFEQNPRPDLMTFQWSLNAWGLESHSCGGLWDLQRITTHHTLWAHHHTRNPKARPYGLLDWINNVTYDWDIGFILGDSTTPASWKANVRGNYFVCPPGNLRSVALEKASLDRNGAYNFTLHVATNLFDKNGNTLLDGSDYGYAIASGSYQASAGPITVAGAQVPVAVDAPLTAYKKVVSRAGPLRLDALAGIPLRDEVDTLLVNNLVALRRQHVSHESQTGAANNGLGFLNSTPAPVDTDRDGMPDSWESTLGWNAGAQDHNTALANAGGVVTGLTFFPPGTPAGYTRLEEYLHFLALPHATLPRNSPGSPTSLRVDLRRYTSGFSKAPVSFSLSNITNGTGALEPDGCTAVFTPAPGFAGRARFDFTVADGDGSTWTQTLAVLVSSAPLPRDLTWKGDGSSNQWNTNAPSFLDGSHQTAFVPGDNVRFDDRGSATPPVALGLTLYPGVVQVDASQDYTWVGSGSLSGAMSLTKEGGGTLVLGTTNSFGGGIRLNGGLLVLSNSPTAAGSGPITFHGGHLVLAAPGGPATYSNPLLLNSPATIFTAAGANFNQALSGAVTGSETLSVHIPSGSQFSPRNGMSLGGFTGTLQLTGPGTLRWYGGTGSSSTAFDLGTNGVMITRDGGSVTLGRLSGGPASSLRGAATTVAATTYVIGQKGGSTFAGSVANGNVGGTNSPLTALTKLGSATLTLAGTNSHTGNTTVGAGTLRILGHNGPSPVIVSNSATLAGTGTLGGWVTVHSGGRLAPGNNGAGTLTLGNGLTLNSATLTWDFADVTTVEGGVNDLIAMAGGPLNLSGTTVVNPSFTAGSLANGSYTLITGGASTSGGAANLAWGGGSGGRQTFSFDSSTPGTVRLVVGGSPAATLLWHGLANNRWDATTTNWLAGGTPERFYPFDTVVFDDTGAGVPTVNVAAAVHPAALRVDASTDRAFVGAAAWTGSGTLTKSGSGTLTIATTNSAYSGHVVLAGGALTLGAGASLGTGNLSLGGGATFNLPPSTPQYFHAGSLTVPAGQAGTVYSPGLGNGLTGSIVSGDAHSVLYISGGVSFGGTDNSQFEGFSGTVHILPGATLRFSPDRSGNTYGSLNPTFVIDGTLRPRNAGNTVQLGALSGTGTIAGPQSNAGAGNTTYVIGGNHLDVTFDGIISSNSAVAGSLVVLKKIGSGQLVLTGNSTHTGGTAVEAGSLLVNNATGSGTGTGGLSIAGGATLGGSGFIGSPTALEDSARLAPGNNTGALTFNSDLSLGEFSELDFELGTNADTVVANGALSLAGRLHVTATGGFGAGSYTLFSYHPTNTFNYSGLILGTAPAGFGYAVSTNTPGQVRLLVAALAPPRFGSISLTDGSLTLSGSGGSPGADYCVLSATNVPTPEAGWARLATNQFDSHGHFIWTHTPAPATPQQFYRLTYP